MSKVRRHYQSLARNLRDVWFRITSQHNNIDAEQQLESRTELQVLQSIASGFNHDFQTPLCSMQIEIELLRRRYQHDERCLRSLENLDNDLRRMADLMLRLRLFMGIRPVELRISEVDIGDLIIRAIRSLRHQAETIVFKVDKSRLVVQADTGLMVQAIENILKNSIEAINRLVPAETGLISIAMKSASGMAVVEIRDNGFGMTEEQLSRMRVMLTSKKPTTTYRGLGLLIAARILDLHHGLIEIDSKHTGGTSVVLSLPLRTDE